MSDVLRGEITAARGEHEFTIDLINGYGVGWNVGDEVEVRRVRRRAKKPGTWHWPERVED